MHLNFIRDLKILLVEAGAIAGTTTLTTDVVDMRGFSSVCFVALTGDVTDTSVLTLTMQGGEESDGSDAADLALSAAFTAGAADADNKLIAVDAHKPRQRYVRATLDRATANAVVGGIVAILYNGNEHPVTQDANLIASAFQNDPAFA